jgi:hypothetical protein
MDAIYDYRALLGLRNAWLNSKTVEATKKKTNTKSTCKSSPTWNNYQKEIGSTSEKSKTGFSKNWKSPGCC